MGDRPNIVLVHGAWADGSCWAASSSACGSRLPGAGTPVSAQLTCRRRRAAPRGARTCIPNHSLLQRVAAIELPVFVAAGDRDPMILPRYSYLLAGLLPDARLKIYPDSAHGFLFQYHDKFAADAHAFLEESN